MEDVLAVYTRPRDPDRPLVCLDESSKQLLAETRVPIPMKPRRPARCDYEYERNGTANLFMMFAPPAGWRQVKATDSHTAVDYAHVLKDLADVHFANARTIVLVQDNLNIDRIGGLEADAPDITRQPIRVFRHDLDGIRTVGLVDTNCPCRTNSMAVQEDHDLAHDLLLTPGIGDAFGADRANTRHLAQAIRLSLDRVKHPLAESTHKLFCVDRADAPDHAGAAYGELLECGRLDGKGGLAPRTVHHVHRVLYEALGQAERRKLIVRNPAPLLERRDRPKIEHKPVTTIDTTTTATVFDAARERRLFIPLVLAALCGLRRGEITALRWKSVDLENSQLAVVASTEQTDAGDIREKEAKSGRARTVALPAMAVEELRRWRAAQAEELLRLGIRADDSRHVVTRADGEPVQPRSLTHVMSAFLEEWGVTLHKLRHSHASHMLAAKVHPKVVQERLGHSSIAITMDIYSHLMPNMQGEAAAAVDGALRAAINKRSDEG